MNKMIRMGGAKNFPAIMYILFILSEFFLAGDSLESMGYHVSYLGAADGTGISMASSEEPKHYLDFKDFLNKWFTPSCLLLVVSALCCPCLFGDCPFGCHFLEF